MAEDLKLFVKTDVSLLLSNIDRFLAKETGEPTLWEYLDEEGCQQRVVEV